MPVILSSSLKYSFKLVVNANELSTLYSSPLIVNEIQSSSKIPFSSESFNLKRIILLQFIHFPLK